jgi:putative acetyltransferase
MEVVPVTAPTDQVRQLVGELDAELGALYRPEQRHGLSLDAIFAPHIRFFIALGDSVPLGCGGVALFSDFAEVKRMYVRPEARGTGVAQALMTRLTDEARAAGLNMLRLETGTQSFAAIAFYRKSGFEERGAFEPYATLPPEQIFASLFMERPL